MVTFPRHDAARRYATNFCIAHQTLKNRHSKLNSAINSRVKAVSSHLTQNNYRDLLKADKKAIDNARLTKFHHLVLRVVNCVIKIFKKEYAVIDELFESDKLAKLLVHKYQDIISKKSTQYSPIIGHTALRSQHVAPVVRIGLFHLQRYQLLRLEELLLQFKTVVKQTPEEASAAFQHLPPYLKKSLSNLATVEGCGSVERKPLNLLSACREHKSIIDYYHSLLNEQKTLFDKLINFEEKGDQLGMVATLHHAIQKNERLFHNLATGQIHHEESDKSAIYDISVHRLLEKIPEKVAHEPINVTMVGVEYAGLIKQGGLAEALEGMSQSVLALNPNNRVKLIFPKYSHLPQHISEQLGEPSIHRSSSGSDYRVYSYTFNGVDCRFIENSNFELNPDSPNIYGPDFESMAKRFANFSSLAADFIAEEADSDIIHLHDWHTAGVALKLRNSYAKQWSEGDVPPILYTFHNNNRIAQGRLYMDSSMDPKAEESIIKTYQRLGIANNNENLFISVLGLADAITTVSETFGIESQQFEQGEGASFALRQAAKIGKVTGILNGINTTRFDPANNPVLKQWIDPETETTVDLSYSDNSADILIKKRLCREQLQKWLRRYAPDVQIDLNKPLVTFIGRFDPYQKGMDKLDKAIQTTLENGGQFICMGTEDKAKPGAKKSEATTILDRLQEKYPAGVLFIRDYKDPSGRYHYQEGSDQRPGIGPLIRAATDIGFVPSRFEPCGYVQTELMQVGALVVASSTGGLKQTIITREQNPHEFNGFLFERGNRKKTLSSTLKKALAYRSRLQDHEKIALMQRLMRHGKNQGWTGKARRINPAAQYRLAYENAIQFKALRNTPKKPTGLIELMRNTLLPSCNRNHRHSPEERYLQAYQEGVLDSEELARLYKKIPPHLSYAMPSPYGKKAAFSLYQHYGSHLCNEGVRFCVKAPGAVQAALCLTDRDGNTTREIPMRKNDNGDWFVTVADAGNGTCYQYKINGRLKVDPYARQEGSVSDPKKAPYSVVYSSRHRWSDQEWIEQRKLTNRTDQPMSVYEVHPHTWKKTDGRPLNYREFGRQLIAHCRRLGYTHVELMGILEHPRPSSWGYKVTGYFAPSKLMGSADDFKAMIDDFHQHRIGVILDWVPAHFAKQKWGLYDFDGNSLYNARGLRYQLGIRKHFFGYSSSKHWFSQKHFDFRKKDVRDFLISSAHFWLNEMHIDGLRVDCVRSILSSEDKKSAELFLCDLNSVIHRECPGTVTIAEDYSGDKRITNPVMKGGFDFDIKWHTAWTHFTMDYFSKPFEERSAHYDAIKNAVLADDKEKQMMFISHDQIKHEMPTLLNKTPGIDQVGTKYRNVQMLLSFMLLAPGKKLQFMGNECGNESVWNHLINTNEGIFNKLDLNEKRRLHLMQLVARLNGIYKTIPAFSQHDSNGQDITWIDDPMRRVHAYRRKSDDGASYACVHNFTSTPADRFTITIPKEKDLTIKPSEIFNNIENQTTCNGPINTGIHTQDNGASVSYTITVPPLTTLIIKEI